MMVVKKWEDDGEDLMQAAARREKDDAKDDGVYKDFSPESTFPWEEATAWVLRVAEEREVSAGTIFAWPNNER